MEEKPDSDREDSPYQQSVAAADGDDDKEREMEDEDWQPLPVKTELREEELDGKVRQK